MKIITETELRDQYKQSEFKTFKLPAGTRLTPSAQQFLSDRRIQILEDEPPVVVNKVEPTKSKFSLPENKDGYTILATGEMVSEKPEQMTHLHGKTLVPKNHPVIKFRGRLDSFQACLINAIVETECAGQKELAKDLRELLDFVRSIMSAEVRQQPLEPLHFHGLNHQEIREHSHYPSRFYGIGHFLPQPEHGKLMAQLNILRAGIRELEIAGLDAFEGTEHERPDILQALNRTSSLIYIMMLKLAAGQYKLGC